MYAYLSVIVVFFASLIGVEIWMRAAKRFGMLGEDVHKRGRPKIPEMGGVVILPSLLAGLLVLYITSARYFFEFGFIVAIAGGAWLLGIIDDVLDLRALPKFSLSLLIGLPIFIFINPFQHPLLVPFMRPVRIPLAYPFLALALIGGAANSLNSYDVVNGSATFSATLIATVIGVVLFLRGDLGLATIVGMIAASSFVLFIFNMYPARLFIGDTGSFSLGAAIAAAAIVSYNESFLFVALLPMIINAAAKFMSVGKIYEHHRQKVRITYVNDQGKIASYPEKGAISLVRLLVVPEPLTEFQVFLGLSLLETIATVFALLLVPFFGVPLHW
ncbi:MAG: hypothetical protein ACP5T2_01815 [Thermoprotei archaeon]